MSHYVVQALLDGNIMFHRETPLESGVENLINEGLSMLLATTGGAPGRDAFVEVLRYYDTDPIPEVDLIIFADEVSEVFFEAESLTKTKGKVRTMSGKPHKVRKLKQDQGITPEEAARRISLKSETHVFDADTMEWDIDYLESYETPYGTKLDGVLYNPTTGESAEFEGITIETSIPDIDPLYANMEDIPTYEAENEDNLGPMFMAEEKKNCGCGQDPCKTYGSEEDERVVCFICNLTPEESDGEYGPMMSTLGGDACKDCAEEYGYRHPRDMIYLDAETFEAPKTMTKSQAKRKVIALMKPYWLKELKTQRGPKLSRKQYTAEYGDDYYDAWMEDWDWWDYHVKTVQSGKYGGADAGGDTILREALPYSYWTFINRNITWEGSEKYDDEPYETMYLGSDFCIYDRTTPWSEWSASDKRKLNKLEKRWEEEDDMDFMDYIEQKDAIEHKYNKTIQHRTEASKMNCKHCGPYFKNRANIKNWDVLGMMEDGQFFYYWEYPASLKKQVKALIPALKGIKPKPKARAKKTTTKPKAKAAKKTTTRKAKPKAKAKAKTGRKAPTISATKRKIGTRMRGNDGKMWQVKKSGKSQRWMAGAETQTQTFHSSIDSKFDELL